ncbi:UNVERIFIED_CONTAM: hypothetical protein GTU68_011637 [Idotea baltica]|nr:hypothetical protein [Idotea baltica]
MPGRESSGSGVIISNNGYIVTNNHVVEGADVLEVNLYDNRTFEATLIGSDPSTDLALIKINENDLPKLELANSDNAKVGQWVLAVGNPFNLTSTVTAGIVSAKGRNINILKDRGAIEAFIQTDAAVNPGNSGGALVNTNGDLLGINTAIATPTGTFAGYSFAVPVNIVKKVVDDLMDYGTVQRAYLGVMIRDLDSQLAKELDLDISQGIYVDSLMSNSGALDAGIRKGDVIVSVDGAAVNSAPELQELIARQSPGNYVDITVNRNGSNKAFNVKLKNLEGNTQIIKKEKASSNLLNKLGVELEDIDQDLKDELEIAGGAKINRLFEGKVSQNTDIKEGFIITKIDQQEVKSVKDLIQKLEKKGSGGVMLEGVYANYPGVYYYAFGL